MAATFYRSDIFNSNRFTDLAEQLVGLQLTDQYPPPIYQQPSTNRFPRMAQSTSTPYTNPNPIDPQFPTINQFQCPSIRNDSPQIGQDYFIPSTTPPSMPMPVPNLIPICSRPIAIPVTALINLGDGRRHYVSEPTTENNNGRRYSTQSAPEQKTKLRLCSFCKRNGERREFCFTHTLKDQNGKLICPILRKYECPICGGTGDDAHTTSYCPQKPKDGQKSFGRIKLNRMATGRMKNGK